MNRSVAIAIAVARKDLTSEWRTRELVPALGQFVVLALVIANFGFQIDSRNATVIAPGVLWLALVFAGLVAWLVRCLFTGPISRLVHIQIIGLTCLIARLPGLITSFV